MARDLAYGGQSRERIDLFEPQIISQLRKLQDKLPPFSFGKAKATIEAQLGKPMAELFSEFDEKPIAAAAQPE